VGRHTFAGGDVTCPHVGYTERVMNVIQAMGNQAFSVESIMKQSSVHAGVTYQVLARLVKAGAIKRVARGEYVNVPGYVKG